MDIWKLLCRLWAVLSLASLAIDGGCFWLDRHSVIATLLLDRYSVNYVTLFLWSASVPFVLGLLILPLGSALLALRWALEHGAAWLHFHHGPMHGVR